MNLSAEWLATVATQQAIAILETAAATHVALTAGAQNSRVLVPPINLRTNPSTSFWSVKRQRNWYRRSLKDMAAVIEHMKRAAAFFLSLASTNFALYISTNEKWAHHTRLYGEVLPSTATDAAEQILTTIQQFVGMADKTHDDFTQSYIARARELRHYELFVYTMLRVDPLFPTNHPGMLYLFALSLTGVPQPRSSFPDTPDPPDSPRTLTASTQLLC